MTAFFKKNLLPESFDEWFLQISSFLRGGLIICIALFLAVSLYCYSPLDESFNTSSTLLIQNKFDWLGSYSADLLMQFFGYASYFYIVQLLAYGYCIIKRFDRSIKKFLIFSILATLFTGFAFNLLFLINGGFLAYMISLKIITFLNAYNLKFLSIPIEIIFIMLSFFFFIKAFNKKPSELKDIGQKILNIISNTLTIIPFIFQKIQNIFKTVILKQENDEITSPPAFEMTLKDLVEKPKKKKGNKNANASTEEDSLENDSQEETVYKEGRFDISQEILLSDVFHLPSVDLLDVINPSALKNKGPSESERLELSKLLQTVLEEFGIKGEIVNIKPGPVVTMYELKPAPGIKTSRVISLADDIARSMSALSARIAVIPGQNLIGIELPNSTRVTVFMRELLLSERYQKTTASLPLILGKDIGGEPVIADLARMPHLLVAGTTGSGKSVSVNAMILSILFKLPPDKCRFIMIDPKMLELSIYDDIPHLLTPVVTDPKKAVVALKWAVKEMENRYQAMSKLGVRNIDGYNARVEESKRSGEMLSRRIQTGFDPDSGKPIYETQNYNFEPLPFIIVVVDEMADLMLVAGKEIESAVQRLAQMARAAGIHLIMATQRPSVDVITGTIKANFPTRISFMVTSKIDSRTILGEQGAEQLLGQGDMLYMAGGGRIQRVHGPFMKDNEVERIVKFLQVQGEPTYIEQVVQDTGDSDSSDDSDSGQDPVYKQAVDLIRREGKVSTSFIQRHLSIGYNRAARIVDQMEAEGIVSPANHTGKREIIG
ncbi:MAG: hypothetical protein HEEMFOPI_00151 [Holosporales bacterium]